MTPRSPLGAQPVSPLGMGKKIKNVEKAGIGASLWPLTRHSVQELHRIFKDKEVLDAGVAAQILKAATAILASRETVVDIEIQNKATVTVVGDTHGQVADVIDIFTKFGLPTKDRQYLFNGDYVDRGDQGCEVVLLLCAHMICDPSSIQMLRGNHEDRAITTMYGFADEARRKYSNDMYNLFVTLFSALPLAGTINNTVIVMHGGLFREAFDAQSLAPLSSLRGVSTAHRMECESIPEVGVIADVLWSDPLSSDKGGEGEASIVTANATRGSGCCFSDEAATQWLDAEGFSLLVRSHEGPDLQCLDEGYSSRAGGRVSTVFSARDYAARGNQGAVVTFGKSCHPKYQSF